MSCRIPDWDAAGGYEDIDIPDSNVTTLEWRDATISLGYYYIVLATEYKLLSDAGEDTQPTLIELYYALNALNRLDLKAEVYLEQSSNNPQSSDLNGLFLRDDIPANFAVNWQPETLPDDYPLPDGNTTLRVDADAQGWDYKPYDDFNEGNVESLDQLTTLLLGLRFVVDLVDNVTIQPTSTDTQMALRDEAKAIIWRMVAYLNDVTSPITEEHEWSIKMPNGDLVPRGNSVLFASYPIMKLIGHTHGSIAESDIKFPDKMIAVFEEDKLCDALVGELEGENYLDTLVNTGSTILWNAFLGGLGGLLLGDLNTTEDIILFDFTHCTVTPDNEPVEGPLPIKFDIDDIGALWQELENQDIYIYKNSGEDFDMEDVDFDYWTNNFNALPVWIHHVKNNIHFDFSLTNKFWENGNFKGNALNDDNMHMLLEQALFGNVWGLDYVQQASYSYDSDFYHYPLMWAVLNNYTQPFGTVDDVVYNMICDAPCEGPWADPNNVFNVPKHSDGTPSGWASPNYLFQPGNASWGPATTDDYNGNITGPDPNYRGYFPGLDFMVFYNLYHLLNSEELPLYEPKPSCECVIEITENEIQDVDINVLGPFLGSYKEIGIHTSSYLSHSMELTNAASIDVNTDLVICRKDPFDDPTILTITEGASLILQKENILTVRSGNSIILEENSDLILGSDGPIKVILEEGAKIELHSGSSIAISGGSEVIVKAGASIRCFDSSFEINNLFAGGHMILQDHAALIFNSTSANLYASDFELRTGNSVNIDLADNSVLQVSDCHMFIGVSEGVGLQSQFSINNSAIIFDSSSYVEFSNVESNFINSEFTLNGSLMSLFQTSWISQLESDFVVLNNSVLNFEETTSYFYESGENFLEGANSAIVFNGAELHIPAYTTFQPIHPNGPSGYLEFRGSGDHELITGTNSVFIIVGDGPNDIMLKMNNEADLWNANFGAGTIILQDCKVDLTDHGRLWTDMKFQASNVTFEDLFDSADNEGGNVQVWHTTVCGLANCEFVGARLKTFNSKATLNNCDFSGNQSGYYASQGGFNVTNSSFVGCHLESHSLAQLSMANSCLFEDPEHDLTLYNTRFPCIQDESSVELRVLNSIIRNGQRGIVKDGGKLTLKCNLFEDLSRVAVTSRTNDLNMSSTSGAGYNNFHIVQTCIELDEAYSLNLSQGYNNLSGFTDMCIIGTLNLKCLGNPCELIRFAHNNYWGAPQNTFPPSPNPIGPYNPYMWSKVDLQTVSALATSTCNLMNPNGPYCDIYLKDDLISISTSCGTGMPIVRPVRNLGVTSLNTTWKGYEPTVANEQFQLKDQEVDPGNPLLSTSNFDGIALDSALVYAALQMEIYDSLGNDANAVALFHEILTSPLDRSNKDIRWRMEWGRYNMKSAMENMFMQDELTAANNVSTFETPVTQYVDVLNTMTDTILTDSTYKDQFYVEIDKGQLFRTLGNPLMARHIYLHLDDCQLDSLEQSILNNWRQEVDIELSLLDQYINDGISPDSISFEVDTTSYTPAVPYVTSDYYFGVWIDSPTSATFVNCGENPEYRILRNTQNSLNVYPNPSAGLVTLQIEQEGLYDLAIYDISGKQIHARQINVGEGGGVPLDLSGVLSTGNYMIVLENDFGMMLSKLVIAD